MARPWLVVAVALSGCAHHPGASGDAATDGASGDAATGDAAAGDGGTTAPLAWYPGNYGLVTTGNDNARSFFLDGPTADSFDGVEMIYPWTTCEPTKDDYTACFDAINGDIAALPAGKHLILMLQYKSFGTADAVPGYLQIPPGTWCAGSGKKQACGQYKTPNGGIAMIWNPAVADRLHAWFTHVAAYYAPGGPGASSADRIAGIVLPETASGENTGQTLASVGYTPDGYVAAIKQNMQTLIALFPTLPVFQYINYIPYGTPTQSLALQAIGTWALANPHAGIGCPDVGGHTSYRPPGYDTLMSPDYQLHLPLNVAIELMDYDAGRTTDLPATWAEATGAAPTGMAAQFIVWQYVTGTGHKFTTADVATYLVTNHDPNTALPTY